MDWSRIPSLSALRAFEAAARHGNFSKAAAELNVTHAAIAQHVRALEDRFSETLMTRAGRGMALTPAGAEFAANLRQGFTLIADAVDTLEQASQSRPLNISLTPSFAGNWLIPKLGSFWAEHPDIAVNLNPGRELVDLANDGFDMAIRYGAGSWPGVESELLTRGNFVVVARPDLVAGRKISSVAEAAHLPWLWERMTLENQALVEADGLDVATTKKTVFADNELVLSATREGLGCSVQARVLVERDIASGALTQICALKHEGLGYYLVTRPGRETPALKVFKRWLRKVAKPAA
jgi:LysR family glycine cleavage system transcriptional activator